MLWEKEKMLVTNAFCSEALAFFFKAVKTCDCMVNSLSWF